MTTVAIRRKVLGDLAHTRLVDLGPTVTVYRGELPDPPPVITTPAGPDPSGRIAKYVVLFAGAGDPVIELDVAEANTELAWSFTTICVAGYEADCLDLVDDVHQLFFRWRPDLTPELAGHVFGRVTPPPGFDPGSVRRIDRPGLPPRFELPLLWRLPVTTS